MKIVHRTPTELIIRDAAMGLRAVGALLLLFGAFTISTGLAPDPGAHSHIAPAMIGSVLALTGVALIVLPARKTFAFSKGERAFIIATQRHGRVTRELVPLRDIADVSLEESAGTRGGRTYRVVVTLADQRRIPWTSYYTSGYASKRAVVDVVRDFLALEPSSALGSGALTVADERNRRRDHTGLAIMGAVCCAFLGIGATLLVKEQRRLSVFRPVTATVVSTRVEEHHDSDGRTYEPVVVYRYRVNDREYVASRVTPLRESRSGGWAHRVTQRFPVGSTQTAYYDPADPADAYLMRSRSILPLAFTGIPLVGLVLIVAGIRESRRMMRMSRWPSRAV